MAVDFSCWHFLLLRRDDKCMQLERSLEINVSIVMCINVSQVPQDAQTLRKNIYYCKSCGQYLPSSEFQLSPNSKAVGRCHQCCKKTNEAVTREEHTKYTYILQNVCCTEQMFADNSKIAFLMQVNCHIFKT